MTDQKHRIFVGLSFNSAENPEFLSVFKKLRTSADRKSLDLKWSRLENLHLTLKFIGEVDESQVSLIRESLQKVAELVAPFSIQLSGISGLPSIEQARVIYMGVKAKRNLVGLQTLVEESLSQFGPSEFEYLPHITLCRLRNKKGVKDLISPFVRKEFGKVEVRSIQLFESFLQGSYPVYKVIEEFELSGKNDPD